MAWAVATLLLAVAVAGGAGAEQTEAQRAAQRAVADGNNAFSAELYGAVRGQPGNLIVSPLSASAVLALVLQGAGGRTAQQLQAALHLPADAAAVRQGYGQLLQSLQTNDEATVRIANKVYTQRGAAVKEPFQQAARGSFRAEAQELDFQRDNENARLAVNRWVENVTDSKIKDLLTSVDPATRMILVNAIYFKGSWDKPFEEDDTRDEPFHTSPTRQVNVPMMHRTARFGHASLPDLNARVLELPYRGHTMKMLVLLPDQVDGLSRIEDGLARLNLSDVSQRLNYDEVILTMPKFKIESTFQLDENLPQLGVQDLFTAAANLSGITDAQVLVSQVVQKAFVEVTEKGTVAAAATGVAIATYAAVRPPGPPVVFKVDRPFLFLIVHSSKTALFVGRMQRP